MNNGKALKTEFSLAQAVADSLPAGETISKAALQREIEQIFGALQLPVPEGQAFLQAQDGALVFLEDEGCVIRIEPNDRALDDMISYNPFILQPLGRIRGDFLCIEICPGGRPTDNDDHIKWLVDQLAESNLTMNDEDIHPRNCVLLPAGNGSFPQGIPVICDRPAIYTDGKYKVSSGDDADDFACLQDDLYGSLQTSFARAWNGGDPDPIRIRSFWEACRRARQDGILVAGWTQPLYEETHSLAQGNAASASSHYKDFMQRSGATKK